MSTKNFIYYSSGVVLIAFILFQVWIFHEYDSLLNNYENLQSEYENESQKSDELLSELNDHQESLGGLEEVATQTFSNEDIVFPIHEDDFLRFTSPYGNRKSPFTSIDVQHTGLDIATVWKAQVVSIADGIVVDHWPPPGSRQGDTEFRGHPVYGGMIKIDHGDFESLYAHLDSTEVVMNQEVRAGQLLGRVGNTGESRGHHLHIEIEIDGENVNPLLYIHQIENL
ncbi:MAG: M23 family metallopeptidase [archaeon]